ncbi:dATP pyrophosphohydrolase [Clostridium acidisoli DSM 12555]|uniref:dATP pyrophosphohydrolase n=1 Tax=Clostridium acidisoli DSM 12555 TaxID=1121291 RepID=A0A1W1XPQ7_9CLOT|nr:NUDIX pyrophosphatase [Clostridium acidisoli]SMC25953.1 dATP pyrophosphohydrolase [Clostridium acidisoli DSM 12555]
MRAPMQVLVIPYKITDGKPEYCIFKRSDALYWQFIAGGGEDKETPLEAASRESFEEANLEQTLHFYQLTSTFYVPADCISEKHRQYWSADTFVLPEYCFAVNVDSKSVKLSSEHTEYSWVTYEKANELLYWQTNKIALFELDNRIKSNMF